MSEHDHQVALIKWAALQSKVVPELLLLFAIPNGGQRHIRVAQKLKAEGVKSGVPDLMLPVARGGFNGLFVEMKEPKKGRVSDTQGWWIRALREQDYQVAVCYGWEPAKLLIMEYLNGQ